MQELKTADREFYFRCVHILFILAVLAGYLSRTLILGSSQLVAVDSCRGVISLKFFCNVLGHSINIAHNHEC